MATSTFIKNLWEARIIANFHEVSFADAVSTKPTKVDGKVIYFNRPTAGVSKDYTGTIAWDKVVGTQLSLTMDKQKYFATTMDDVDAVQGNPQALDAQVQEESAVMAEQVDTDLLNALVTGVKASNYPSKATAVALTKTNTYDEIVNLGVLLGKSKVPMSDRFIFVNSEIVGLLCKDDRFTKNVEVLANGIVSNAKINGATVVITESVPTGKIVMAHRSAIGYGKQLDNVEALRLESAFADGVRGLISYGCTALKPEGIAVLNYTVGA
ncbi:hypothetical protein SAMN02745248_00584 [Hathewaya proteolytica DSM 3090]|uniref:P22 coat protein-gene protein 5 n=1 Tax=Hathewaya proteolytica DSM 3090 TaxID=1121331 RepID=A0A1M6L168_9CLOT|nr:hypothetical protein [Hathewaya proteolytica]SHJ64961.1 hypothetical protein SAMN02745248_00584 [Hathewaya proteolytica DSM 3090]